LVLLVGPQVGLSVNNGHPTFCGY